MNLQNASNAIKTQVNLGLSFGVNAGAAAANSYIIDPQFSQTAAISEQQRTAYNVSLNSFQTTNFYTAQQFLVDKATQSRQELQSAISQLAAATVDLQKAITVNQMLSTITDAQTANQVKGVIAASSLSSEITSQQVSAYNTSLASVGEYASRTGAFFAASNNQALTGSIDASAAGYNKTLFDASVAYNYTQNTLTVAFDQQLSVSFSNFLNNRNLTNDQFFNQPQIYGGGR